MWAEHAAGTHGLTAELHYPHALLSCTQIVYELSVSNEKLEVRLDPPTLFCVSAASVQSVVHCIQQVTNVVFAACAERQRGAAAARAGPAACGARRWLRPKRIRHILPAAGACLRQRVTYLLFC